MKRIDFAFTPPRSPRKMRDATRVLYDFDASAYRSECGACGARAFEWCATRGGNRLARSHALRRKPLLPLVYIHFYGRHDVDQFRRKKGPEEDG